MYGIVSINYNTVSNGIERDQCRDLSESHRFVSCVNWSSLTNIYNYTARIISDMSTEKIKKI